MPMKEITCICEKTFEAEVPDEVSLSADPALARSVISGDFLAFTCPQCGKRIAPEYRVAFRDLPAGPDILLIPEEDRQDFYRGAVAVPSGMQCVIGYPELVERLRVLKDGLDVRAVESLKYVFQTKAEESYPDADPMVSYHDSEGGDLTFLVTGVVEGKVGKIRAPQAQYRSLLADMDRLQLEEPYASFLKPPYLSIKRLAEEA